MRTTPGSGFDRSVRGAAAKAVLVFTGISAAIVLAEAGLRIGGHVLLRKQERANVLRSRDGGAVRVLCLGESTTMGQYPSFLQDFLDRHSTGTRFEVLDEGVAGTNTGNILSSLEGHLEKHRPDLVVTMMGVNDREWSVPLEDGEGGLKSGSGNLRVVKLFRVAMGGFDGGRGVSGEGADHKAASASVRRGSAEDSGANSVDEEKEAELVRERGRMHRIRGDWEEAERWYRKALELNPRDEELLIELAEMRQIRREWKEAERWFRKVLEVNPRNEGVLMVLGSIHRELSEWDESERWYGKALEVNPRNEQACIELGNTFLLQETGQDWEEAGRWYRKALEINPDNREARDGLLRIRQKKGQNPTAAGSTPLTTGESDPPSHEYQYYTPATVRNYRKLQGLLAERRVKLVCVQYPLRDVRPLTALVGNRPDVFFVDNQPSFREGVEREGYWAYFVDEFAKDFGHCTDKGNQLLAENIGRVILDIYRTEEGAP